VTALLAAPTGLILFGLVALGRLAPFEAVLAWAVVGLGQLVLIRAHLHGLSALAQWIRALAQGEEPGLPPASAGSSLGETATAVGTLRRAWQQRTAALTESARWNASLIDNLPDPLLLLDDGRMVVRANKAAKSLLGPTLTRRDLAAVLRNPMVLEAIDAVLAGAAGQECEFAQMVPLERVFQARIERLEGQPPDGGSVILTLHDLTAQKQIERMRADFVANASHELRTPLAALAGFIETLRGPARDDEEARDRFLAIMAEQAGRMSRLIADLLSLSRIELNEHTPPNQRVDLSRQLIAVAEMMRPLAGARGITIRLNLVPDPGTIPGQTDELTQLVQNLLDNAVKYGREGSVIEVGAHPVSEDELPGAAGAALRAGPAVRITVRDQGEGIAREHLPRLTERFYRVDTARSRKLGGTGLGLAIVKHIVNRHRGIMTIDSQIGVGTTFSVWLPATSPTP
jgi:two-component system phosphate regulon sensor histidine kinase PhoR